VIAASAPRSVRRFGVALIRVAFAFAIGGLLAACVVAPPRELNAAANDSHIVLEPKQELVVRLDANPTAGYIWLVEHGAPLVLSQVDEPYWQPMSQSVPLVGQGGWTTFRYSAIAEGTDTMDIAYRRPWEKNVAPLRTFRLEVTVKKPQ
jgi:inhibitor of cysteine peptidase